MSKEYVNKNVDEIVKNEDLQFPLNMAMASAWILGNFKGINLKVLDMKKSTSLADYFVIASASNTSQASSMANEVIAQMKRNDSKILSKEGLYENADWILLDMGDLIVHIFQETARNIYDLDNLWDVDSIKIPNEYYHSEDETSQDTNKSYF